MIYPNNFEEKIGFSKIRQSLEDYCFSATGRHFAQKMSFSESAAHISRCLEQTDEYRQILLFEDKKPSGEIFNLYQELRRIATPGTFMDAEALTELRITMMTILDMLDYLKARKEDNKYPALNELAENILLNASLPGKIEKIVDEKGEIRDHASAELAEIRTKIRRALDDSEKKIRQIIKLAKKSGWTPEDDTEAGIRNGRMVIPLQATYRRQIQGFVQDESATGQTVYVEPAEVLENNNKVRKLEYEEKREIIRILTRLTDEIRPETEALLSGLRFIGMLDFIRAKARFAIETESQRPSLNDEHKIKWEKARHPLLFMKFRESGKKVVPLSVELNQEHRILVISGPNAGGKSVCLKTIGLLQYMLQCGMLVPAKESSSSGIFKDLFVDIGDEQSIENDLSTYSSHLVGMKKLSRIAGDETLFLIDEFGTGTEPHLGGAIAEAILEHMGNKKATGVVTTHYSNLKLLADRRKEIFNGAMLFDTKSMNPLYELKTGKPGSSFAFEIAEKIGFPKAILKRAESKSGNKHLSFDQQLQQLEIDKKELTEKMEKVNVADNFLSEIIEKYQNLSSEVQERKTKILEEAREEAADILKNANKTIEQVIREIKESQAEKERTKVLRQKLEAEKKKLEDELKQEQKQSKKTTVHKKESAPKAPDSSKFLKKGDPVRLKQQKAVGEIVKMMGKEALVSFDSFTLKTPLDRLEYFGGQKPKTISSSVRYHNIMNDMNKRAANFELQLDVRGKRTQDALASVEKYIDEAHLLSMHEVRILHGKGNGILRMMIRDMLLKKPEVERAADEHIEFGGHGITVVHLK